MEQKKKSPYSIKQGLIQKRETNNSIVYKESEIKEIVVYIVSLNQHTYRVVIPREGYCAELTLLPPNLHHEELALKLAQDYEALRGIKDPDDYILLLNTMVTEVKRGPSA